MPKPIPTKVTDKVRSVVAFVGPTGVGKTTAAAEIAAQFASQGKKVSLITTDTDRVGGLEQIRAYVAILNLTVDVAYTVDEMHDVIGQVMELSESRASQIHTKAVLSHRAKLRMRLLP